MQRPRNTRARGRRERLRPKKRVSAPPPERPRTVIDRRFGEIPLVAVTYTDARGAPHTTYTYDPDYAPPLPPGAVRGDVRRQHFCGMCHTPRYFYVDIERVCQECRAPFTFGAAEQKYWYETLKFHFDSTATRCPACRRKRRSDRYLQGRLVEAKRRVAASEADHFAWLAVAEAIVQLFRQTNTGSLDEALAAARRARKSMRGHPVRGAAEASYWEATCHALAGRARRARSGYHEFLEAGPRGRHQLELAKDARRWLEEHPEPA